MGGEELTRDAGHCRATREATLPKYVTMYLNARGKPIYRFRRKGFLHIIKADFNTPDFWEEYNTLANADQGDLLAIKRIKRQEKSVLKQQDPLMLCYFIRFSPGVVKIGKSANVISRVTTFQKTSPKPLRLLAVCRESEFSEVDLHRRFCQSRLHGELFHITPEIRAFIKQIEPYSQQLVEWQAAEQKILSEKLKPLGDLSDVIYKRITSGYAYNEWDEVL